jgi:hypothetical protein
LAEPEPPKVGLVVEFEVEVAADEGGNVLDQLSAMDASTLSEEVSTNVKAADASLADIAVEEVEVGEVVTPPPTPAPTPPPYSGPEKTLGDIAVAEWVEKPLPPEQADSRSVSTAFRGGALAMAAFMIVETLRAH